MQKMFKKAVFLSVLILCCLHSVYAQQTEECEKVVDILLNVGSEKTLEDIEPYLADNFSILERTGNAAKQILVKLLPVMKAVSYQKKESRIEDGKLILKYSVEYTQGKTKENTFTFNKDNVLTEIEISGVKVAVEKKTFSLNEKRIEYNENKIISVPITFSRKIPLVEVLFEGEKRRFLLDSGSPFSALNAKYITEPDTEKPDTGGLKITVKSSSAKSGDVSGAASLPNAGIVKVHELDFAGNKITDKEIIAFDMSHLEYEEDDGEGEEEKKESSPIYGLIGYDMLKEYDVFLDYAKKTLTLIKPESRDDFIKKNKLKIHSKNPCTMERHIPVIEAVIGNKTYKMGIDTGAESNLLDSTYVPELESFLKQKEKQELVGASGVRTEIFEAKIKAVKIGKKTYKDFLTIFSDISHIKEALGSCEGLLGYPFLSSQPVLISYTRGEIIVFR